MRNATLAILLTLFVSTTAAVRAEDAPKGDKAADKAAACTNAKQIEDMLGTTLMAMPQGATAFPDAKATAGQIMGGANQITEFTGSIKKAFCK